MTRRAVHSKREIENVARIARESGLAVRLEPNGAITMFPAVHKAPAIDGADNDDLDRELQAFEAKHGNG